MMAFNSNMWLSCPRPNPQASLRLFCFPYAGGSISVFYDWASSFLPDIEVYLIQLPGHDNRLSERPYDDLKLLVQVLTDKIKDDLDLPFAFYGHSIGALIAFELAHSLKLHFALQPVHLFVSALRSPSLFGSRSVLLHDLPDAQFVNELEHLYGGIPNEVKEHQELFELLLPTLRADITLLETYKYVNVEPFEFPISVFGGLQDATIAGSELMAWREHTKNSFRFRWMPGNHFFLQSSRGPLVEAISNDLMLFLGSQFL